MIQFLNAWNGNALGSITTLGAVEDARLVALGIARTYTALDGDVPDPVVVGSDGVLRNGATQAPVSGAGNRRTRLAVFGDSRMAGGYITANPAAVSVAGSVVSAQSTNLGLSVIVGDQITLGRNTGCDYMRATVASIVDNDNITANINFPAAGLPSGSIRNSNSTVTLRARRRPINSNSYLCMLLAMLGQPFDVVDCYAYNGCRIDGVIDGQLRDALGVGFDAALVMVSANDYIDTIGNKSSTYCVSRLDTLLDRLSGYPTWVCNEPPLGGAYATAANLQRLSDINAAYRARSDARILDLYAAFNDGTGAPKPGWSFDGLHPATAGAIGGVLGVYQSSGIPLMTPAEADQDAGSARYPLANPIFAGTLGASQSPTGYTQTAVSLVTVAAYGLQAKTDGTGNEWYFDLTATGAGQHYVRCASTAVTAGARYRIRCRLQMIGMVGLDYTEITLRNQTGDTFIANILAGLQTSGTGDSSGTYTLYVDQDVVIPVGVTNVYLRPRLIFDATGGGRVVHSDWRFEAVA